MVSDLKMSHGKRFAFVSFPFFELILVTKLRNFDYESPFNTLMFSYEKDMSSDLNIFQEKIWNFVSFPFF